MPGTRASDRSHVRRRCPCRFEMAATSKSTPLIISPRESRVAPIRPASSQTSISVGRRTGEPLSSRESALREPAGFDTKSATRMRDSLITVRQRLCGPPRLGPIHPMARYRRGMILVGVVLLILGAFSLYNTNAAHAFQSTFNVLLGRFFKVAATLRDLTHIAGSFHESSGGAANLFIMSSVQFSSFQTGSNIAALYSISDAATTGVTFLSRTSPHPVPT